MELSGYVLGDQVYLSDNSIVLRGTRVVGRVGIHLGALGGGIGDAGGVRFHGLTLMPRHSR